MKFWQLPVFVVLGMLSAGPGWAQDAVELWQQETATATAAYQQGDYATAETHIKKALKHAEALGMNDPRYAVSVGDLGAVYFEQERYDDAELYLKRGLALREELLGPAVATSGSAHLLGRVYYSRRDYGAAIPLLARALEIRDKVYGPDHVDTLESLDFLAGARYGAGEYAVAITLFKRLLAARIGMQGTESAGVASVHEWLASAYEKTGNTKNAAYQMERAIAIKAKLSGPDDPALSWHYAKLAGVYQAAGKPGKAESAFGRELAILEKAHGKDSAKLLDTLNRMGEFYRGQGREKDAVAVEQRYAAISGPEKSTGGDLLLGFATAMEGMAGADNLNQALLDDWNKATDEGSAAYDKADYETAGERYAEALRLSQLIIFNEPNVAVSYNNLAMAYWGLGRIGEADANFLQAVDLGADTPEMDPGAMKAILGNYADFLGEQKRVREADAMEKRAAAIQ